MKKFYTPKKVLSTYLIIGGLIFLGGCAGYKSEPLDDFTEEKGSHLENKRQKSSD